MKKVPCIKPDLGLMRYGLAGFGSCFVPYSFHGRGHPRKTWWKFWEKKRTREEFLEDEHEDFMAERKCHKWNNQDFHFCGNN